MTKRNPNTKILFGILSSLAAGTAAFIALAYVRSGGRGQPSPLLPKTVEEKLDLVTSWLDSRFGKAVVDRGMDAIQHALRGSGPDKLVQLLEQVFEPEALEHEDDPDNKIEAKPVGDVKPVRIVPPSGEN